MCKRIRKGIKPLKRFNLESKKGITILHKRKQYPSNKSIRNEKNQ